MKNIKLWSALALIALFVSCSADKDSLVEGGIVTPTNDEIFAVKTISVPNAGVLSFGASPLSYVPVEEDIHAAKSRATGAQYEACKGESGKHPSSCKGLDFQLVDVMDVADIDRYIDYFLENLPEKKANLTIEHPELKTYVTDFRYVSNGEPIKIIPLYTGGRDNVSMNIFYYDKDGIYHQQSFWKNYTGGNWKAADAKVDNGTDFTYKNVDGKGFEFTLPEGTLYGVMLSGNGRHFTARDENVIHYLGNYADEISAIQFNYDGCNFIGFEDRFTNNSSDQDFNDVILCINPKQKVYSNQAKAIVEEEEEPDSISINFGLIDKDFVCQSDDTNIKMGENLENISHIDNVFELRLEAGKIFNVTLTELSKYESYWRDCENGLEQLVFDIRLYDHNLTREEVLQLFNITETATEFAPNSYDIEGILSTTYSYKVNIGFDFDKDIKDIHISPIIYRIKK